MFKLDLLVRDLKMAVRSLARTKGLAITVVLTLALGIGANAVSYTHLDVYKRQELALRARGAAKSDLLASLTCKGRARLNDAEFRNLSLTDSLREGASRPGVSSFHEASAAFTCGEREIKFSELSLLTPSGEINAIGVMDFAHNLDFRLRVSSGAPVERTSRAADASSQPAYHLTGSLSSPQLTPPSARAPQP